MYTFLPLRTLTANPLRTTLTALAITVGVAMVLAASIVGQAVNQRAANLSAPQPQSVSPFDQPVEVNTVIVQLGLAITGMMLLLAAGFVIFNAFVMTITARQREIGALRALGMTRAQVTRTVLVEAGILALAGVGVGTLIGLLLARVVMFAFGTLEDVPFRVPGWGLGLAVTMGLVITLGAALLPARRASRILPLSAIRPGAEAVGEGKSSRTRGMIGLFLLFGALITFAILAQIIRPTMFPAILLAGIGFVILLAGTLLTLPTAVEWVGRWTGRGLAGRFGVAGRLAGDNVRRNLTRSALTTGGMIAGLTTIIIISGVMTMLVETGFTSFALMMREDRFVAPNIAKMVEAGELSFENMSAVTFMSTPIDPDLVSELEALEQEGWIKVEHLGAAPIQPELQISPGFPVVFVEPETYLRIGNFDFFEGDVESALAMMDQGNAVLVMPLIAERFGTRVGDAIPVQTPQGEVMFTIAGIGGNGWNMPAFSLADGERYFGVDTTMLGIIVPEGQDREAVLGEVEKIIDAYPDRMLLNLQDEFLELFAQVQGQFRALLNALLSLGVLLAGLGVVNTMVINIAERGREIGMLRAVGATQRQVRQAIVIEAVVLGIIAALISILLSFLMISLFIAVVAPNGAASIGMRLSWSQASSSLTNAGRDMALASLFSLIFAPLVAALAAYFPARQAAALNIIEATRTERLTLHQSPTTRHAPPAARHSILATRYASLAWRNLQDSPTRTILSGLAVALGVAMVIAADFIASAARAATLAADERNLGAILGEIMDVSLNVVGIVILVAAGFLVFNAFGMAIAQRRRQIGALRALGATRRQILSIVLTEALITGGIGTLVGVLAGPLLGQGVIAFVEKANELLDTTLAMFGTPNLSPANLTVAVLLGVGITFLATLIPARQATRVPPLAALREQGESVGEKPANTRRNGWLGLILIAAIFLFLALAPPGNWADPPWNRNLAAFLILAFLAALWLLLPALIGLIGHATRTLATHPLATRIPAARLIADNLRRSRGRVTLTALTLAVGLGAIVSVTGLMSFTFDFLVHEVIAGILDRGAAWIIMPFELDDFTRAVANFDPDTTHLSDGMVDDAYTVVGGQAAILTLDMTNAPEIAFMPGLISYILDPEQVQRADLITFTEGSWETAMPILRAGCGLLIAPNVAARNHVHAGDPLPITGPHGVVDCTVAGVGSSALANVSSVSRAAASQFDLGGTPGLYIIPFYATDLAAMNTQMEALVARYPGTSLNGFESGGLVINIFDRTQGIMNAMLLLAIVVAALGVVNTTVMSVTERRHELGLLRAVGATRRQTQTIVVGEAALIGLVGSLVGLAAGVGITIIFAVAYGGRPWGLVDLDLWKAAWQSARGALTVGAFGLFAAPLISAGAAWLPARRVLRGSAIETLGEEQMLQTERRKGQRIGARSLTFLAWRELSQSRTRTVLSVLAVGLGVALTIATNFLSDALLNVFAESELARSFGQGLFDQLAMMLNLIGVVITVAAGFLVFNAFGMSITQRRQQIGALRSLGMTRGQVIRLVLLEGLLTAIIGVVVGLVVGPMMGRGIILLMQSLDLFINQFAESTVSPGVARWGSG